MGSVSPRSPNARDRGHPAPGFGTTERGPGGPRYSRPGGRRYSFAVSFKVGIVEKGEWPKIGLVDADVD
jgi:hypothetical protein